MGLLKSTRGAVQSALGSALLMLSATQLTVAQEVTFADRSEAIQRVADVALPVRWRTVDSGNYKLERDLESLYIALYNTTNLPLKLIDDPKLTSQSIITILRQENIPFGRSFSVNLDAMLCDLNPKICDRNRARANSGATRSALGHVGGYVASKGKWSQNGRVPIVVPALSFETGTAIIDVKFRPELLEQKTIEALMSPNKAGVPNVDCSDWKRSCFEVVQRLNRARFDPKRSSSEKGDTIKLPATELFTELAIHELGAQGLTEKFDDAKYQKSRAVANVNTDTGFTDDWRRVLAAKGTVELATASLSGNITSVALIQAQTSHDTPPAADPPPPVDVDDVDVPVEPQDPEDPTASTLDMEIFELINHPFRNGDESFPDYLKRPIAITVLDFAFDNEHCGFPGNLTVDDSIWPTHQPQLDRERASQCGAPSEEPANIAHDHGTHVIGVIGSKFGDTGILGHNPFAKLRYVPLDKLAMRDAEYFGKIRSKLREIDFDQDLETTSIVNISWRFQLSLDGEDDILRAINENEEQMLFVVAAGNEGKHFKKGLCSSYPACFDTNNVLTVVGLDRDKDNPGIWIEDGAGGSNSYEEFGIGAIATDVKSTVFGGYVAPMSGTSQAAPQVAAAAALLLSRFEEQFAAEQPKLLPIRIKNRLIYTSDIFPSMNGKLIGGRMNVLRALDMARTFIAIERDGEIEQHHGDRLNVPQMGPDRYIECLTGPEEIIERIRVRHLRRMEYDEARRKYVVLYQEQGSSRDSPLIRMNDCKLNTSSNVATFDSDEADAELSFQLRDIRSYISPMF